MWMRITQLVARRPAGVTPKVNLREHTSYMPAPSVNKAAHSALKPEMLSEVQNRVISGTTKRNTCVRIFF